MPFQNDNDQRTCLEGREKTSLGSVKRAFHRDVSFPVLLVVIAFPGTRFLQLINFNFLRRGEKTPLSTGISLDY